MSNSGFNERKAISPRKLN